MKTLLFLLVTLALVTPASAQLVLPGGSTSSSGSGTVTSIATGCQATGGTITTSGTISTQLTTSNTYTSSQTLQSGDACHQALLNATSAATLTFSSVTSGQYGRIININTGVWTLAAGSGSIKGCTLIAENQSADWQFDGTNYNVACGAAPPPAPVPMYTGVAGTYYASFLGIGNSGTSESSGFTCFTPIFISNISTWEGAVVNVTTAYSGTGTGWGLALYASGTGQGTHAAINRPDGSPIASTSFQTGTGTSNQTVAFASHVQITPGWYWIAFEFGDSTQRIGTLGGTAGDSPLLPGVYMGSTSANAVTWSNHVLGLSVAATGGTFPTLNSSTSFSEITTTNGSCAIALEMYSVP